MYPDALAEREAETLTAEAKDKIAKFDAILSKDKDSTSRTAQGQGFCGGICLALTALVVNLSNIINDMFNRSIVCMPFIVHYLDTCNFKVITLIHLRIVKFY